MILPILTYVPELWTSGCIEAPPFSTHTVTVLQNARSYANSTKTIGFSIFRLVEMQRFVAHTHSFTYIAIFNVFGIFLLLKYNGF